MLIYLCAPVDDVVDDERLLPGLQCAHVLPGPAASTPPIGTPGDKTCETPRGRHASTLPRQRDNVFRSENG